MSKVLINHNYNNVTEIILNNPEKRNAFDKDISETIIQTISQAEQLKQRVIVIKANITHNIFSAGHDLNELTLSQNISDDPMFKMFNKIFNSDIPIIAQVEGDVYAGALHLLMICDMVYALNNVNVIITANKMGVPFDTVDYKKWLSIMGAHKVKELFLTASKINAYDAYNSNIFNSIYEDKQSLENKINSVCENIIECSEAGIKNTKKQINTIISNISLDKSKVIELEQDKIDMLSNPEFIKRIKCLVRKIHNEH